MIARRTNRPFVVVVGGGGGLVVVVVVVADPASSSDIFDDSVRAGVGAEVDVDVDEVPV